MLSRRISVWLVSFLAVLMIYFVYNRISRTPPIPLSGAKPQIGRAFDVCDINGKVGMVGDVGIRIAKNARYVWLDAQKQQRVFGFEELLHQDGNEWEIEKPYYTIYRPDFKCTISGRHARVTVDVAGGQVTPRRGNLKGNVKIEILPLRKGGPGEGVVYLDDVVFVAEKSALSSEGQVEFVSQDAQLVGRGMELVFGEAGQVELLKLKKLQSLHIRQKGRTAPGAGVEQGAQGKKTGKPLRQAQGRRGSFYKCVLDSNVVVETAGQRLMGDVVTITDIFIAGTEPNEPAVVSPSDQNQPKEPARTIVQEDANLAGGDIAISCDGSVIISSKDYPIEQKIQDTPDYDIRGQARQKTASAELVEKARGGKALFWGQKISYSVATSEAVADGESQIVFDVNRKDKDGGSVPATVSMTAQKRAVFSPESNEVVFEGGCRGTISQPFRVSALSPTSPIEGKQADSNAIQQYIVLSDKLELKLKQKPGVPRSSPDIERLVATGDVVHLASTRKIGERLLAGVELKCARWDYLADDDNYIATGPGLIKMDNSRTDESQKGLGRFSMRRKCYAFLRQFDELKFDGRLNHLTADRKGGSMLVDYFPLTESGADNVAVTASHVEADILETAGGRMEVSGFVARGAVTYEDKDKQFAGSVFIYDVNNGMINVFGDKSRPCLFNGAIVDSVQYDLKTNRAKAQIKAPGAIK